MSEQPVSKIGKYENLERIGYGGFAVVYKARDPDLKCEVALKLLRAALTEKPDIVERFLTEARQTVGLRHNGIVRIYAVGETQGRPYIVMEYLPKGSLADRLSRLSGEPMPLETAVPILEQVAAALDYVHTRQLVHRDVKPGNILFGRDRPCFDQTMWPITLPPMKQWLTIFIVKVGR